MSCIITYKGNKYTQEQFKEYILSNKNEFSHIIASNKNVIDSFKRKMEGIDYVFSQSPELSSIGSKSQYLQYLSTIFKTSKVKDIVYHGSPSKYDTFKTIDENAREERFKHTGAMFTSDKNYVNAFGKNLYNVVLNIKNPEILSNNTGINSTFVATQYYSKWKNEGKDGVIGHDALLDLDHISEGTEYVVFEPEQIHILGSKQDIEGFKEFVGKKELSNYKSTNPLKSYDSPDLIASMSNLLQDKFNVKINFIHDSELNNFSDVPEINKARAFVKNGEYYINIDKASIAEPLHEILHMVLASMKYSDFDNYMRLVESVENHPLYNDIIKEYSEINSDILEETFITLFTETVRKNILASGVFTEDSFEESVKNAITQMFDLGVSLNRNSTYELIDMNVKDILFDFSSNLLENRNEIYNTDNAVKMMALSSLYRKLLKDGDLIQKCNG